MTAGSGARPGPEGGLGWERPEGADGGNGGSATWVAPDGMGAAGAVGAAPHCVTHVALPARTVA